jgi:beta-lactamase regulating signal transducer with metallopeptidase domain
MKRAIFPDEKLLQPIPTATGAHANISGNVSGTNQNSSAILNMQTKTQNSSPVAQNTSAKNGTTFPFFALWSVIILIIILAIIFIYKKIGKKYGIKIES